MAKKIESQFLSEMRKEFEEEFDDLIIEDGTKIEVIPSSSVSLNVSTGIGGIPRRRFTEIYGIEAAGKSTLALDLTKNALFLKRKVLYIDVENGMDLDYAKAIIGDYNTDSFLVYQPDTAEQALTIAEKGINSGEFGLVIVDSVGALASGKEKEAELTDFQVADIPRLVSKFCRRNVHGIRSNDVAILFINQVRDKIGAYIPTLSTPGGHLLRHFYSMRIQLSLGDKIKEGSDIIGNNVKFTVIKNKLAIPYRSATFPLIFGKGIDFIRDTMEFGAKVGVIRTRGPYYFFEDMQLGQGLANSSKTLFDSPELLDRITKACYNILITKPVEVEVEDE